jgi:predicted Ser/Thr protein kinase
LCIVLFIALGLVYLRRKKQASELEMQEKKAWEVLDIERQELLSGGHSGDVYRALWKGTPIAIKTLKEEEFEQFKNEAAILRDLNHISFCSLFFLNLTI